MWQAIISGTFSIIRQSLMLGCFPRVKIVHTSGIVEGQIYIPEANWTLMVLTIIVVAGFRDSLSISNAYGGSCRPAASDCPCIAVMRTCTLEYPQWKRDHRELENKCRSPMRCSMEQPTNAHLSGIITTLDPCRDMCVRLVSMLMTCFRLNDCHWVLLQEWQ